MEVAAANIRAVGKRAAVLAAPPAAAAAAGGGSAVVVDGGGSGSGGGENADDPNGLVALNAEFMYSLKVLDKSCDLEAIALAYLHCAPKEGGGDVTAKQ